jgi:hypothetical protein
MDVIGLESKLAEFYKTSLDVYETGNKLRNIYEEFLKEIITLKEYDAENNYTTTAQQQQQQSCPVSDEHETLTDDNLPAVESIGPECPQPMVSSVDRNFHIRPLKICLTPITPIVKSSSCEDDIKNSRNDPDFEMPNKKVTSKITKSNNKSAKSSKKKTLKKEIIICSDDDTTTGKANDREKDQGTGEVIEKFSRPRGRPRKKPKEKVVEVTKESYDFTTSRLGDMSSSLMQLKRKTMLNSYRQQQSSLLSNITIDDGIEDQGKPSIRISSKKFLAPKAKLRADHV